MGRPLLISEFTHLSHNMVTAFGKLLVQEQFKEGQHTAAVLGDDLIEVAQL